MRDVASLAPRNLFSQLLGHLQMMFERRCRIRDSCFQSSTVSLFAISFEKIDGFGVS